MPKRKKVEQEEVYHVEVITKARVSEDSEWEYFVKWAGYGSESDSWEPAENVKQCDRLLASFWKHVGTDDEDYKPGYVVAAQEDWINKEKRYFRQNFVKPSKRKSEKVSKKDQQGRETSKSSTSHITDSTSADSSSPDEEEPSVKTPPRRLHRKPLVVDTESEPDSDDHSRKLAKVAPRSKIIPHSTKENPKVPDQVKRHESTVANSNATSMVPPRVIPIRTHQDQRANPLVKSMSLPTQSVEAGSSLSTKQRIAAGILQPPTGPKPLPHIPKKSLPALSFKKNKPTIPTVPQTKDTITSSASAPAPAPASPISQTTTITNDTDVVTTPQPMDIGPSVDLWGSISDDGGLPGGSPDNFTAPTPRKSQEEINADNFLQTVPIPVEMEAIPDQPEQSTVKATKIPTIPKIPKKWKWSGDLLIDTSKDKGELLCAVTIADPSGTSNTSHINLLLSPLDSLRISKLYPLVDLSPLLRACGKPQYFGTLESSGPTEEVVVHGLAHHLTSEGLAAAIPLFFDATEVAVLIVFPGAQQKMSNVLQVPEQLSGSPFLVVLLPFLMAAMTSANVGGQRPIEAVIQASFNMWDMLVPLEPPQEAPLYQAMALLCFPKALLDFLNSSSTRSYCIWPSPDQTLLGLDTVMLQYVLKSTKAILSRVEEDPRVVFVSNQHLEKLYTMPTLVTKLANSPETQFWTYGSPADMTCQNWKLREIYPLGGIVTFTTLALAQDFLDCYKLMSQIIEHPLWDCYLLPEVLAVIHQMCSNAEQGSSSETILGPILDHIDLGLISVTRMPKLGYSNQMAWLSQAISHPDARGQELLEVYLEALKGNPATLGMTAEQLISFTNDEITKDLQSARVQPVFMENYRRFIVIRAVSEASIPLDKDGLEWSSLPMFSFKDDYFQ